MHSVQHDRMSAIVRSGTINVAELKKLRGLDSLGARRLQEGSGNGCAGDPPGYPSYFTRSVYTTAGDTPKRGPTMVITYGGRHYVVEDEGQVVGTSFQTWEQQTGARKALFDRLWIKPPVDSARVLAWVTDQMRHFARCYYHPTEMEHARPKIATSFEYRDDVFRDDPRFNDEWRKQEQERIDRINNERRAKWAEVARFENHVGVRHVLTFYPEFPRETLRALILTPPTGPLALWYESEPEQPTPWTCPGQYGKPHPYPGKQHCQFCGWQAEDAK